MVGGKDTQVKSRSFDIVRFYIGRYISDEVFPHYRRERKVVLAVATDENMSGRAGLSVEEDFR